MLSKSQNYSHMSNGDFHGWQIYKQILQICPEASAIWTN